MAASSRSAGPSSVKLACAVGRVRPTAWHSPAGVPNLPQASTGRSPQDGPPRGLPAHALCAQPPPDHSLPGAMSCSAATALPRNVSLEQNLSAFSVDCESRLCPPLARIRLDFESIVLPKPSHASRGLDRFGEWPSVLARTSLSDLDCLRFVDHCVPGNFPKDMPTPNTEPPSTIVPTACPSYPSSEIVT